VLEENLLPNNRNNYLLAALSENGYTAIAYVDVSTGDFFVSESHSGLDSAEVQGELAKINPGEYLLPAGAGAAQKSGVPTDSGAQDAGAPQSATADGKAVPPEGGAGATNTGALAGKPVRLLDEWYFSPADAQEKLLSVFGLNSLKSLGLENHPAAVRACGAVLRYAEETQKDVVRLLRPPKFYSISEHLILDESAISSLEIEDGLIKMLERTVTPMGSRLLRSRLLNPLTNPVLINDRLDALEFFVDDGMARRAAADALKNTCDIERVLSRLSSGIAQPRDLIALRNTLERVPSVKAAFENPSRLTGILRGVYRGMEYPAELSSLITAAISETPGGDIKKGGVIKRGYSKELDELRRIASGGKSYIAAMEQRERVRTGINSLKVGYTPAFGYYIEVTKANLDKVPPYYVRRQTLVNNERFVTEELKEYESKVLSAEEKSLRLEKDIFDRVKDAVLAEKDKLQALARAFAETDFFSSLSAIAAEKSYARPVVNSGYEIKITDGRHPMVEAALSGRTFVPNDLYLDGGEDQIILLTGPNMAGKSTYLRQAALIAVMAQAGSFVPAAEAQIGIIDRIFTRIGAADNLTSGDSTFMVEMRETAKILHNATPRSLLILDEVGRGTSTFDGISIAWAVLEYLSAAGGERKPKVLFATHYFELTGLAEKIPGIKNFNVSVKEWKDQITFLHKIVPGSSDRSYGIHVAKLAGLPASVIERANAILVGLEKKGVDVATAPASANPGEPARHEQIELPSEILEEFDKIDPENMTPMEALLTLHKLKERYKK
jgi:DNA mismatch repair protein MutS